MNKSTILGAIVVIVIILFLGYSVSTELKKGNNYQKNISLTPTIVQDNANIIVESPVRDSILPMPFTIKGKARVFENQLNYRVLDSRGNALVEGSVVADTKDAGQFGFFEITVSGLNTKGKATVQLFDYSAKDGAEIDKVILPVVLK